MQSTEQPKSNYLADYFNAVPAKWYGMTIILLALIGVCVAAVAWLTISGLDWWWIASGLVIVWLYVLYSFLAYRKVAIERDQLKARHEPSSNVDITLMEWRKEHRQSHMPTVSQIPNVLRSMWSYARETVDRRKNENPTGDQLVAFFLNVFEIGRDDVLLKRADFSSEQSSLKTMKRIGSRMGLSLKKSDAIKAALWRRRMAQEMDNLGFGLRLKEDATYGDLLKQLDADREGISQTRIDNVIAQFTENLHAYYSLELLRHYGKVNPNQQAYVLPKIVRDTLREMSQAIENDMLGNYRRVRDALEVYAIGG